MIETNYYILDQEQYQQFNTEAKEIGVSLDYYLDEFCDIQGPYIQTN